MKITGSDLTRLGIVDEVIKEPAGGNNWAPLKAGELLKAAILKHLNELSKLSVNNLRDFRYKKFRKIGSFLEPSTHEGQLI